MFELGILGGGHEDLESDFRFCLEPEHIQNIVGFEGFVGFKSLVQRNGTFEVFGVEP